MQNIQKYKSYLPKSPFFIWLISGIIVTGCIVISIIPAQRLFTSHQDSYLSWDSITIQDTTKAMKEIYNLIQSQYYITWSIDQSKMSRQAISAFVDALWDPFSSYLPPAEWKELNDAIEWHESIDGIWAILSKKDGGVLVEEVLKSSPAAKSGLKPMDMIMRVNWSGLDQLLIWDIIQKIRWPKWTVVNLTIARILSWDAQIIEKSVIRDIIVIPSVTSKILTGSSKISLWYIALSLFAEDTDERLQKEITNLSMQWISWLILDLRWNGWWLLPESVDVASHFLPAWTPIVQVKYRLYADSVYKAEWDDMFSTMPLVILIDWFTASASEIITLAIKEWRCKKNTIGTGWIKSEILTKDCDVLLVGDKSFGKWSIQNLQELSFWWSVKMTVGKWFSPSGLSIDRVGIQPDISISFDKDRYQKDSFDTQLEKAKSILSQLYR